MDDVDEENIDPVDDVDEETIDPVDEEDFEKSKRDKLKRLINISKRKKIDLIL